MAYAGCMHIVQINSHDTGGGAERIALTLHREYSRRAHRSSLLVGSASTSGDAVFQLDHDAMRGRWAKTWRAAAESLAPLDGRIRGAGRLRRTLPLVVGQPRRWVSIRRGQEDFEFPATSHLLEIADLDRTSFMRTTSTGRQEAATSISERRPSLAGAAPLPDAPRRLDVLRSLCALVRLRAVAHGMWELSRPFDLSGIARDATAHNWRRKRDIFASSRLYVASPSRWLMDRALRIDSRGRHRRRESHPAWCRYQGLPPG